MIGIACRCPQGGIIAYMHIRYHVARGLSAWLVGVPVSKLHVPAYTHGGISQTAEACHLSLIDYTDCLCHANLLSLSLPLLSFCLAVSLTPSLDVSGDHSPPVAAPCVGVCKLSSPYAIPISSRVLCLLVLVGLCLTCPYQGRGS